jgi:predicted HTH domain antitoxin
MHVTIPVEVPSEALKLSNESPEEARTHLLLLWLLDQARCGHLSIGKAAELLGIPVVDVMALMASHGIPHPNYTVDDLRREVGLAG